MIITKNKPFTAQEIKQLKKQFEVYIKTAIDIQSKICSAGMDRHFQGEQILLKQGSRQSDIWGGGIDLETREIKDNIFGIIPDVVCEPILKNFKLYLQEESKKWPFTIFQDK